jgi:hypothetical protein
MQGNTRCRAKKGNFGKVDAGHVSNQIGQHKKCAADTMVHAKIGQLCELDPGHVSNQIGKQQKMSIKTVSAKFRKINLNFGLISYFAKLKIEFRFHPRRKADVRFMLPVYIVFMSVRKLPKRLTLLSHYRPKILKCTQ